MEICDRKSARKLTFESLLEDDSIHKLYYHEIIPIISDACNKGRTYADYISNSKDILEILSKILNLKDFETKIVHLIDDYMLHIYW